jgi:esterase/lipase superfamily enzyme
MKKLLHYTAILYLAVTLQLSADAENGKGTSTTDIAHVSIKDFYRAENKILIISNRNFTDPATLTAEKGLHPENKRFFFIAGSKDSSTVITSYQTLEEAMSHLDKNKNTLVYVNGYGKSFEGTIKGGQKLSSRYGVNAIMFDWPTDKQSLRATARNSRKVSSNLAMSLSEIDKVNSALNFDSKVSLVFHSMGNHVAKHLVESGNIDLISEDAIDNVILNAAAVKSYDHNRWVEKLKHKEEVYIVINKFDYVLRGASLVRGARQLGNVALGELADNGNYIDFSDIAEREHGYYLGLTNAEKNNSEFFDFYNTVFQGLDFTENNKDYLVSAQ